MVTYVNKQNVRSEHTLEEVLQTGKSSSYIYYISFHYISSEICFLLRRYFHFLLYLNFISRLLLVCFLMIVNIINIIIIIMTSMVIIVMSLLFSNPSYQQDVPLIVAVKTETRRCFHLSTESLSTLKFLFYFIFLHIGRTDIAKRLKYAKDIMYRLIHIQVR